MFQNRVLRKLIAPKKDEIEEWGGREDYVMRSFMICTSHRILFG
jgi:hypothetical protein